MGISLKGLGICVLLASLWGAAYTKPVQAGIVQIHDDQLWIDGQAQPQLYGAEVQYFRLRGGPGRNIPRDRVIAEWNQALDHVVEAGMNAVSFYIPWDFHEYAEGKFDFTGTVDEDGDGNPDYPSRDVMTFLSLIEAHGIKHILVRPGPYINAEWGFLGFGAVPLWFHEKYPDSHARNSKGQRTTLYSYEDSDFLSHAKTWLTTVYQTVIRPNIGPGRPISFIQIDNETNFQWQSLYNHDYGPSALALFRTYLQAQYPALASLNLKYGSAWTAWDQVRPPTQPGQNLAMDQDWYRFQDFSLHEYLAKIRSIWTGLGVTEPTVLFTLAESFNATENGLLPNYQYRNSPDVGMMTVNLYPKTYETADQTLLNLPFKADHDVKAADSASDYYLGHREAFVMGPEIQGGWWKGTTVSEASRRQTYLTTLGHGLKALFVYYFNEGYNWETDWLKSKITPFFTALKADPRYLSLSEDALPDAFWTELDARVASQFLVVDTRSIWKNGGPQPPTLYFDAALGPDAQPQPPLALLKEVGQKIVGPYGAFLGKAHELEDPVCLVQDTVANAPSPLSGVDSRVVQSDLSGGLLAVLMHAGINARIHHWNLNPTADLLDPKTCRLIVYQDTGFASPELIDTLAQVIDRGGGVLTFIGSGLADAIRQARPENTCAPIPLSPMNVVGYQCTIGIGALYSAKVPIYDVFNTDFYYQINDAAARRGVFDRILSETKITPRLKIVGGGDRTVAFARANPAESELWVTVKTARHDGSSGMLQWTGALASRTYRITDVLAGTSVDISGPDLATKGFSFQLGDSDSRAFSVNLVARLKGKPRLSSATAARVAPGVPIVR